MKKQIAILSILGLLALSGCKKDPNTSSSTSIIGSNDLTSTISGSNSGTSSSTSTPSTPSISTSDEISSSIPLTPLQQAIEDAIRSLDNYLALMDESRFSEEDWETILSTYESGKTLITNAKSEADVSSNLTTIINFLSEISPSNIDFDILSAQSDGEYLYLTVNARIIDISSLDPVTNLSCTLGTIRFIQLDEIDGQAIIVLQGVDVNLSKGDYVINLTIQARIDDQTSLSIPIFNGFLKNLETFKNAAVAELNDYLVAKDYTRNKYGDEEWQEIESFITLGLQAITAADSFETIEAALNDAKLNIDSVPQSAIPLADYKQICLADLDELYDSLEESLYHPENWNSVVTLYNNGIQAIEDATTQRDVIVAFNAAVNGINGVSKNMMIALNVSSINEYNADFISIVFTNFPTGVNLSYTITGNDRPCTFSRMVGQEMHLQLASGLKGGTYTLEIKGVTGNTIYFCSIAISGGQIQILPTLRTSAKSELDQYAASRGQANYSPSDWNKILVFVSSAKASIDNAQTAEEINAIVADTKTKINGVQMALANYKELMKGELTSYVGELVQTDFSGEDWNAIQSYLSTAIASINAATTNAEVDEAFNTCKTNISLLAPTYLSLTINKWLPHGVFFIQIGWSDAIEREQIESHSMQIKDVATGTVYNGVFNRFDTTKDFIYSFADYNGSSKEYYLYLTLNAKNGDVYKVTLSVSASGSYTKVS